jgi:hypothetical protein
MKKVEAETKVSTEEKKWQKAFTMLLMVVTLLVLLFERITGKLSDLLGKWLCGNRYMQAVNGHIGDESCGFNTDMHLSLLLIIFFMLGVILYIVSRKT